MDRLKERRRFQLCAQGALAWQQCGFTGNRRGDEDVDVTGTHVQVVARRLGPQRVDAAQGDGDEHGVLRQMGEQGVLHGQNLQVKGGRGAAAVDDAWTVVEDLREAFDR